MAASKKDQSVSLEHVGDPTHSTHLLEGLNLCRQEAAFCDVTIIVEEQRFPAHKAVLTSASDYFQGMFSSGFQESTMSEVTIPGNGESFAQILDFIYTGYFTLTPLTVVGILEMACYMVLTKAVKLCAKYLMNFQDKLTIEDCFEVWSIAVNHDNLADIAQFYRRQVVQNFLKCGHSQVFLENCTARVMIEILGDEDIESDTITEEQILEVTLIWLKHDWEQRKVHAVDLLKKIHLGLVPIDRLYLILGEEVLSIPECKDLVAQVVHLHDIMNTDSPLLLDDHPELFATRNTITAMVYPDTDVAAGSLISLMCRTKHGCHKLTKMADVPNLFPYEETDELKTSVTVCVTDSGHMFAAGGKDIVDCPIRGRQRMNWDWLSENNFYRYDAKKNEWITLPPMEDTQFVPGIMFQADEYIYCFGYPANVPDIHVMTMEKYSLASKEWKVITHGLGYVTSVKEENEYMLIKHLTLTLMNDGSDPANVHYITDVKVALYRIYDDRVFDVTPEVDLEIESSLAGHNNKFYLVTVSGKVHRIRCINFNSEEPSIAIADDAVVDADIIKKVKNGAEERDLDESEDLDDDDESEEYFTFDKRRLGMIQVPCECPSHNKERETSVQE